MFKSLSSYTASNVNYSSDLESFICLSYDKCLLSYWRSTSLNQGHSILVYSHTLLTVGLTNVENPIQITDNEKFNVQNAVNQAAYQ